MKKDLYVDANPHEIRVALLEDGELAEMQVELRGQERLVGNIYKGKVANILPGMQAAFVDIGLERNAFLYAGDILVDKTDFEFPGEGEEEVEHKLQNRPIQDLLKPGQEIMVQVLKQQGGTKGARVTTHVILPGRLMVLMPTVDHVGVSRKIVNEEERERLKEIFYEIKPQGEGVIVRTMAEGGEKKDFVGEVQFLSRLWKRIQAKADLLGAPRLIHSEETLLFRIIRDLFDENVSNFIINDQEYYEKVLAVVNITMPELADRVKLYPHGGNIFDYYGIEPKLEKIMQRKVWLKSGSYLVIDETEALTAIDVNTGKYIGEDNLQDTILNTNIEAAYEIARQLRLRDIGGIVVIDFIDMEIEENKQKVVDALITALKKDRTKTNVLGITSLGLVEMTRKKVRRRLSALMESTCPYCDGRGKVYHAHSMAMKLRREVIRQVAEKKENQFVCEVPPNVAQLILEKNNQGMAILPDFPGKAFFLAEKKEMHMEEFHVFPASIYQKEKYAHGVERFF